MHIIEGYMKIREVSGAFLDLFPAYKIVAYLVNGRIVVVRSRSHGDGGGVVCLVAEDGPGDGAHRR